MEEKLWIAFSKFTGNWDQDHWNVFMKYAFAMSLPKKEIPFKRQVAVPIIYDGIVFNEGLQLDVLVDDLVICELQAQEKLNAVWQAQILSHLKLTDKRLGFLVNFNVPLIKDDIKRIVL